MKRILLFLLLNSLIGRAQNTIEVYFDFNKSDLNAAAKFKLDSLLSGQNQIQIAKIYGYTDKIDNTKYNDSLSVKRAQKVFDYFKESQVSFSKIMEIKGFGENFKQSELQNKNRKAVVFYNQKPKPTIKKGKVSEISNFFPEDTEDYVFNSDEEKKLEDKFSKAQKEDIIILENLEFELNSEKLVKQSQPILLYLLTILQKEPKLKFEIYGHICCNPNPNDITLSSRRAKYLFDFLIKNGISTSRLGYKGFGSSKPLFSIPEKNHKEEQSNRRVEIVIVEK